MARQFASLEEAAAAYSELEGLYQTAREELSKTKEALASLEARPFKKAGPLSGRDAQEEPSLDTDENQPPELHADTDEHSTPDLVEDTIHDRRLDALPPRRAPDGEGEELLRLKARFREAQEQTELLREALRLQAAASSTAIEALEEKIQELKGKMDQARREQDLTRSAFDPKAEFAPDVDGSVEQVFVDDLEDEDESMPTQTFSFVLNRKDEGTPSD